MEYYLHSLQIKLMILLWSEQIGILVIIRKSFMEKQ